MAALGQKQTFDSTRLPLVAILESRHNSLMMDATKDAPYFHDEDSLDHVISALRAAGAEEGTYADGSPAKLDIEYLREALQETLSILKSDRNPAAGLETMFDAEVEKRQSKSRKGTAGGRPRDSALATAVHSLADLYIRSLGECIDAWEIGSGPNSHFPVFVGAALAPLFPNQSLDKLIPRFAKYWERERPKLAPIQSFAPKTEENEVLSPAIVGDKKRMPATETKVLTCSKDKFSRSKPPTRPPMGSR
ncbi:MAG: hypothetical protein U0894_20835 [Pirellulales bacterium]